MDNNELQAMLDKLKPKPGITITPEIMKIQEDMNNLATLVLETIEHSVKPKKSKRIKRLFSTHTTAYLRKELHHPMTNKWMRNSIYAELLRRKHAK